MQQEKNDTAPSPDFRIPLFPYLYRFGCPQLLPRDVNKQTNSYIKNNQGTERL